MVLGLCLRCREEYLSVLSSYKKMETLQQDNVSCSVVLTKQDRLGIVEHMYDFSTGEISLWEQASCSNCYEKNNSTNLKANHTKNFEELYRKTMKCFQQFYDLDQLNSTDHDDLDMTALPKLTDAGAGSLCQNCSEIYNKLRTYFWETVVPTSETQTLNGVCYDIRDRVSI